MSKLKTNQCDTLYFALEDPPKRIQKRLLKQGNNATFNGSRLLTTRMTPSALRSFLKANPQIRAVIIDTLQKMLGMEDLNNYSETVRCLSELKAIADELEIAIVVIHHTRKGGNNDADHMESALGSTGINATADCTLTMYRKRGASEATLKVTGRDVEDKSYTLSWNSEHCTFSITGEGPIQPDVGEEQQQIIDLLESEERYFTPGEIAKKLNKTPQTISGHLKKLLKAGRIDKIKYGQWCAKGFGDSAPLKKTESPNLEGNAETSPDSLFPVQTPDPDWAALFD